MKEHEIECIGGMIVRAKEYNLLAEVVWSFGIACRNNKPLEIDEYELCCEEALLEWDI